HLELGGFGPGDEAAPQVDLTDQGFLIGGVARGFYFIPQAAQVEQGMINRVGAAQSEMAGQQSGPAPPAQPLERRQEQLRRGVGQVDDVADDGIPGGDQVGFGGVYAERTHLVPLVVEDVERVAPPLQPQLVGNQNVRLDKMPALLFRAMEFGIERVAVIGVRNDPALGEQLERRQVVAEVMSADDEANLFLEFLLDVVAQFLGVPLAAERVHEQRLVAAGQDQRVRLVRLADKHISVRFDLLHAHDYFPSSFDQTTPLHQPDLSRNPVMCAT